MGGGGPWVLHGLRQLALPPQVINGLMDRLDWEIAIRTPLYSLPAGSGNALAASLNHYAG